MAVRIAQPLFEERRRRPDQLEVGKFEFGSAAYEPVRLADVGGQHAAPAQQVVGQLLGLLGVEQTVVAHIETQGGNQMIHQVLADLRRVVSDPDTELRQLLFVTDPGQHQQLRGIHRAGTQHDLASSPHRLSAAITVIELDAHRAGSVEDHPADHRVGQQGQVRAVEHRLEVGVGTAPPGPAALGDRGLAEAVEYRTIRRGDPVARLLGGPQPRRRGRSGAALR